MTCLRVSMIGLERVERRERFPGSSIERGAHPRKETGFLVSGMTGRGGREVPERLLEHPSIGIAERFPMPRTRDDEQGVEKPFNAPVAVAEQAQRLVEPMIGGASDPHL